MCCIREVKFPELKGALKLWIEGCEAWLHLITRLLIVVKVERLREALNLPIDAIRFSNGWVDEFKRCHALQHHQHHGEAGSVNLTHVKEEHIRMQHQIQCWVKQKWRDRGCGQGLGRFEQKSGMSL